MVTALAEAPQGRDLEWAVDYVRRHVFALTRSHVRELRSIYGQSAREMSDRLQRLWIQHLPLTRDERLWIRLVPDILEQIDFETVRLTRQMTGMLERDWPKVYRAGYYGEAWMLARALGADFPISVPVLPVEAIQAAMMFPYEGLTWFQREEDNRAEFIRKLRRQITLSQVLGESIPQATKRLREALGVSRNRAELLARTEIMRASNLGQQAVLEANKDIVNGFRWQATLDERTCPVCGPLDGRFFPIDAPWPPKHPRCRCVGSPATKSAAELGLPSQVEFLGPRLTWSQWKAKQGLNSTQTGVMP